VAKCYLDLSICRIAWVGYTTAKSLALGGVEKFSIGFLQNRRIQWEDWKYFDWCDSTPGYLKISGMIDASMDSNQCRHELNLGSFRIKPDMQRLIADAGGSIVNVISRWSISSFLVLPERRNLFFSGFTVIENDSSHVEIGQFNIGLPKTGQNTAYQWMRPILYQMILSSGSLCWAKRLYHWASRQADADWYFLVDLSFINSQESIKLASWIFDTFPIVSKLIDEVVAAAKAGIALEDSDLAVKWIIHLIILMSCANWPS